MTIPFPVWMRSLQGRHTGFRSDSLPDWQEHLKCCTDSIRPLIGSWTLHTHTHTVDKVMARSCRDCQSYAWQRLKVSIVNCPHTRGECGVYSDSLLILILDDLQTWWASVTSHYSFCIITSLTPIIDVSPCKRASEEYSSLEYTQTQGRDARWRRRDTDMIDINFSFSSVLWSINASADADMKCVYVF